MVSDWVHHDELGKSLDECYLLDVPNEKNSILLLKSRINSVQEKNIARNRGLNYNLVNQK